MMSANFEFVSLYCPYTLALRHVTLLQDIDAPRDCYQTSAGRALSVRSLAANLAVPGAHEAGIFLKWIGATSV